MGEPLTLACGYVATSYHGENTWSRGCFIQLPRLFFFKQMLGGSVILLLKQGDQGKLSPTQKFGSCPAKRATSKNNPPMRVVFVYFCGRSRSLCPVGKSCRQSIFK
jgi:hypothetical protein